MSRIESEEIDHRMRRATAEGGGTMRGFPGLLNLARRGEPWALERLGRELFSLPISSLERGGVATLFGHFGVKSAAPRLVCGLDAASLDLVHGALQSLRQLNPGSRSRFSSPRKAFEYWLKHLRERAPEMERPDCEP